MPFKTRNYHNTTTRKRILNSIYQEEWEVQLRCFCNESTEYLGVLYSYN